MKRLEALPYLFPHIVLAVAAYGLAMDDIGPIQHVTQLFLLVIVVDHLLGSANNRSMSRATTASRDAIQSLSLWPTVPLHVALVLLGLERAADYGVLTREFVVLTVSVGFVGAMFTIPAAHELVHRATRVERLMGLTILGLFAYPHFAIEHVGGHHRNLGTPRDPATARFGESFFAFYERAIVDSAASAWALEARRLCRLRRRVLGVHNRLLRYLAALAAAYTLIALYFGAAGVSFMVVQSIIGLTTLEVINYVQHYGLVRRALPTGRYERITAQHSWNSNHVLSNWLLLNLPRHSDHHDNAARSYRDLRSVDDAPQLPTGYFGLFLLALVPPLWRKVMDPRVRVWREKQGYPK